MTFSVEAVWAVACPRWKMPRCGCPIPGSDQGQVGWALEQPALAEGVPARGRGVELDEL